MLAYFSGTFLFTLKEATHFGERVASSKPRVCLELMINHLQLEKYNRILLLQQQISLKKNSEFIVCIQRDH